MLRSNEQLDRSTDNAEHATFMRERADPSEFCKPALTTRDFEPRRRLHSQDCLPSGWRQLQRPQPSLPVRSPKREV